MHGATKRRVWHHLYETISQYRCNQETLPHICLWRLHSAKGCIRFDSLNSAELLWILKISRCLLCLLMLQCEEGSMKPGK